MKINKKETVKSIETLCEVAKECAGINSTHNTYFGNFNLKSSNTKMTATFHVFEIEPSEQIVYTYWIIIEGNDSFYFSGHSKEELKKDLERFTEVYKSEKEFYTNYVGMSENAWNEWNS